MNVSFSFKFLLPRGLIHNKSSLIQARACHLKTRVVNVDQNSQMHIFPSHSFTKISSLEISYGVLIVNALWRKLNVP